MQPFLPSPEAVAGCGVPLGQLAPSLLSRLKVIQHMGSAAASSGISAEAFLWALQVCSLLAFVALILVLRREHVA